MCAHLCPGEEREEPLRHHVGEALQQGVTLALRLLCTAEVRQVRQVRQGVTRVYRLTRFLVRDSLVRG